MSNFFAKKILQIINIQFTRQKKTFYGVIFIGQLTKVSLSFYVHLNH